MGTTTVRSSTINQHFACAGMPAPAPRPRGGSPCLPCLGEVLFFPPHDVARVPVGVLNLLCATMLPDTADLNIPACLKTLDEWTEHVRHETERHLYRFRRQPADFEHSEAYYRVLMMVTVLQEDCGVRYNPGCVNTPLFMDSSEGFIHGLLRGSGMGTCANMPVLYAAVGRKLGYPIYLCLARAHVFCRWATRDGRERFNIEGSGRGLKTRDDDHYKQWPHPISEREVYLGHFLRNLGPLEELALFMATRGHCLLDRGQVLEAIVAYSHAHRLAPADPHYFAYLLGAINREIRDRQSGKIPSSYREAEIFQRADCPKLVEYVLDDSFPRVEKAGVEEDIPGRLAPIQ
jgi:hypothetical protein